ncbi:Hypothetical protein R9X50_00747900 [Acrodontium crateriforme]|uniref:RRM domain-containing protein n=1 Tax=Acrodontium crateriforme TaxID=150365 RepID=A0AAQ3M9T3_9PEZI|nr:Hypothetical protein R9X50_00747900 [Acrodontium crateriforme]
MSGKLDQSLDQIMTDRKNTNPKPRRARTQRAAGQRAKAAIAAPAGGIQKNTKGPKNAPKGPAAATAPSGESKILVSNLPPDVTETLVKDFFHKAVGGVKRVVLAYGPNGRSRGEATVTFNKAGSAAKAQAEYNNVKVDERAMKIEIIGGVSAAAKPAKGLQERMTKPKNAAKENEKAGVKKNGPKAVGTANGDNKGKQKKKSGRAGRPKPKTAEELDAEMQDYFGGDSGATNGAPAANGAGAAQPAAAPATADTGMEDEVL